MTWTLDSWRCRAGTTRPYITHMSGVVVSYVANEHDGVSVFAHLVDDFGNLVDADLDQHYVSVDVDALEVH